MLLSTSSSVRTLISRSAFVQTRRFLYESSLVSSNAFAPILQTEQINLLMATNESYRGIYVLELNTPNNLNAMTERMGHDISLAVRLVKARNSLRTLVLAGNGKSFSAGGDLKFLTERITTAPQKNVVDMLGFYSMFLSIRQIPVPTIACMHGHAVGAGLCLALACDLRLVENSEKTKMGLNFTKIGISPGMAGSYFLPMLVGQQNAARMIYTGDLIGASEAVATGLALKATEPGKLRDAAFELATSIAASSPVAVRASVSTLRGRQDEGLQRALQREADAQAACYAAKDLPEALSARKEERKPVFDNVAF